MKVSEKWVIGLKLGVLIVAIGSLPASLQLQSAVLSEQALAQDHSQPAEPSAEAITPEAITPDDVQASSGCPSAAEMHQNRIASGVTEAEIEAVEAEHLQNRDPAVLPSGEIIYRTSVSTMVISSNGPLACYLDSHTESVLNSEDITYIGGPLDNQ